MNTVEFDTELSGKSVLTVPQEAAVRLPKAGKAHVIVLTGDAAEDREWQRAAYEQFLRDDASEDAIYDTIR